MKDLSHVGVSFIVEPSSTRLTPHEVGLLRRLKPSAILLRKRNFQSDVPYSDWLKTYSQLVSEVREAIGRDRLILCIDHEGGRVIRPPLPITPFPYPARWADKAREVGEAMAAELKSLAINVNFAPVADIHSNPDNPVISERAFGRTAKEVSNAAVQFAGALTSGGIAPCAKHYPGHGDTREDSHFRLPRLDLSLEALRERELVPFQALIQAGVPMVMGAHIMFPKIDPDHQATLSRIIMHDLLRQELGFAGVVITDALGMAAIKGQINQRQTIAQAVSAGNDLLLAAGDNIDLDGVMKMAEHYGEALACGEISRKTWLSSVDRINRLLAELPNYEVTVLPEEQLAAHAKLLEEVSQRPAWSAFDLNLPGFE